jgi:hypothetical protein
VKDVVIVYNSAIAVVMKMKRMIFFLNSVAAVIEIILNLLAEMGNVKYIVRKNVLITANL